MLHKTFILGVTIVAIGIIAGPSKADNVDELFDLFMIREDLEAQYQECLKGSSQSIEAELEAERELGELDIEKDDEDWGLLVAIYAEYYSAICGYLSGDEILNFYRAEFRNRFSSREIDDLIAFHQTPLGRKLNNEWFRINRVFGDILNQRQLLDSTRAQQQFEQRMEDFWNYRDQKSGSESREHDA